MQPQNERHGALAQLVEHRTENPCVPGSILGGTTPPFISPVFRKEPGFLFLVANKKERSNKHSKRGMKGKATISILLLVSLGHLLNDMFQAVIPAIYPMIKESLGLSFVQIGVITHTNQITSSLLQPLVGYFSDKHPRPYGLAIGMCFTLTGLMLLSMADSFSAVLLSVAFVGVGSSVLHPESSKVARLASGGAKGMAQSIF